MIFENKTIRNIAYAASFVLTAILILVLSLWAGSEKSGSEISIKEATVRLEEGVREEYLVGEKLNATGVTLEVDGEKITDVKLVGDTSSAGLKKVEVSYQKDGTYYRGYFPITVFAIRHYAIQSLPTDFHFDKDGNLQTEGLVVWAELNAAPTQFELAGEYDTTIVLPASFYQINLTEDESNAGAYNMKIAFGSTELNYYCVDLNGRMIALNSPRRVLTLQNKSGTADTLQLFVTQVETSVNDGEEGAYGYYLYTSANGEKTVLQFKYYLDAGVASHFCSATFGEGMVDAYASDEGYDATFNGVTFHANKLDWHKAVLDWDY